MKLSIIGTGNVGAAIAYAAVIKGLCREVVLVNRTRRKAEGKRRLAARGRIWFTSHAGDGRRDRDTGLSDVVVLTASAPRDATIQGHAARNAQAVDNGKLVRELMPQLVDASPDAVFLIVTNPVDVMTYVAWRCSGLPAERVIGTGTLIDSARFRAYLSQHMHIHPDDIRAYVLGEHGDTQFPALSVAATGGERFDTDPANFAVVRTHGGECS